MRKKVLVTREVFDETLQYLAQHFEVASNQANVPYTTVELVRKLAGVDAALIMRSCVKTSFRVPATARASSGTTADRRSRSSNTRWTCAVLRSSACWIAERLLQTARSGL